MMPLYVVTRVLYATMMFRLITNAQDMVISNADLFHARHAPSPSSCLRARGYGARQKQRSSVILCSKERGVTRERYCLPCFIAFALSSIRPPFDIDHRPSDAFQALRVIDMR